MRRHSAGDASCLAALLLPQILPVFSVVAPCQPGASPPSVLRRIYEMSSRLQYTLADRGADKINIFHGQREREGDGRPGAITGGTSDCTSGRRSAASLPAISAKAPGTCAFIAQVVRRGLVARLGATPSGRR